MKEILRIQHGCQDTWPEEALADYNLEVYENDILYIQGNRGSGLKTLIKVLAGDICLKSGTLYLWDEKTEDYSRNTAMRYKLWMITGESDMVMNMSVADNLEAVRPVGFPLQLYRPQLKKRRIQKYLDECGMHVSAGDYVFLLSSFQQMELSIIKARLHGARLIGLDMTENKFEGKEAEKLCALIRQVNQKGVSFLIFSEDYSAFAEIADRIQYVTAGREQKEWYGTKESRAEIRKRMHQDIYEICGDSAHLRGGEEEGLLGLYDTEWERDENLWDYFRRVKENNPEIWEQYINAALPGERKWNERKTILVPAEAAEMLPVNLSLADNIILSIPERVCKNRFGVIKNSVRENVVREFRRRFRIEDCVGSVEEMDWVHRKILAVYRWELAKPEVIFLENPYSGLTVHEKKIMTDYLCGLKNRKIRVVLLSGSIENLREVCSRIMITENGKSAKITTI